MVCFSPAKKDEFEKAATMKSGLKISNIKQSVSKLKFYENEIKLSDNSEVDTIQLTYEHKPFEPPEYDVASLVNIGDLHNYNHGDFVSIEAYACVERRPVVQVHLSYSSKPLNVKEVTVNDDTGSATLSIWETLIPAMEKNGTYQIANAKVKSVKGILTLTSNSTTKITKLVKDIKPSSIPQEMVVHQISMPPDNVGALVKKFFCKPCKKFFKNSESNPNPNIFVCSSCNSISMSVRTQQKIDAKLEFSINDKHYTISIYGPQLADYFKLKDKPMPEDLQQVALILLQDNETKLLYNNRYSCVGFEKK